MQIEYFTDGKKIEDPMLIAEMTKAGTIESDVMLFNIDSKGSAKVGSGKEAIVEVFMKVFNEMQEDIDSITKTKGNDFSKIQGRFDTRLSLSASNVDEVIRKRVLAKNETATQTLRLLYEQKESIIKNLITFTADTADKKLYADKADFADCYPFIPYQFNLLGQVLTAVRTHGASGKHMKTSLKSLQDKFGAAPYGFDPKDVQWLVAMLFKLGRVSLTLNSQSLSLLSTNADELVRYITSGIYSGSC